MSIGYNHVTLIGNLTRDPELSHSQNANNTAIAKFGLAINERFGDKESVVFVDVTVFGKQAENCHKYLSKGSQILVDGKLNYSKWTAQDGSGRQKLDVIGNMIRFLNTQRSDSSTSNPSQEPKSSPADDVPF